MPLEFEEYRLKACMKKTEWSLDAYLTEFRWVRSIVYGLPFLAKLGFSK